MIDFFEIDFLEAGKKGSGDAICLRYGALDGDYTVHVVDGGYADDGPRLVSHLEKYYEAPAYVDHMVLTHPDGDHAAGLMHVLENAIVETIWMNRPWEHVDALLPLFNYEYTRDGLIQRLKRDFPHVAELEKIANKKGVVIQDAFSGNQIGEFTVLAPSKDRYIKAIVASEKTPEPERKALIEGSVFEKAIAAVKQLFALWGNENLKGDTSGTSPENETSIVQFANLCEKKVLLTGDAGVEALEEAYYVATASGVSLPGIDRFQVPHHGSRRNVSSDILDKWLGEKLDSNPEKKLFTAIISANHNDKQHPKNDVVRALTHRGASVLQTNGVTRTSRNAPDREGWVSATPLDYPDYSDE